LLLTPVVSIPERELGVWEDGQLAARVRKGVSEAQRGTTVDLGDFTVYVEDNGDE
jgi:hypothetical protein